MEEPKESAQRENITHTHARTDVSATDTTAMTRNSHGSWYVELRHGSSHTARKRNAPDKSHAEVRNKELASLSNLPVFLFYTGTWENYMEYLMYTYTHAHAHTLQVI
jgi:hypothetical protein